MRRFSSAAVVFLCLFASPCFAGTMAKVLEVINGNSMRVEVRGKELRVRLIGVATPDPKDDARPLLKQLGVEATAFLTEYTRSGWVYLEFLTPQPIPGDDGFVEAAVYGGHDSAFINEKLVAEGFGVVNRKARNSFRDQLLEAEKIAKSSSRGIWGSFFSGSGKDVANGKSHQGKYIGDVAPFSYSSAQDVTSWIMSYE